MIIISYGFLLPNHRHSQPKKKNSVVKVSIVYPQSKLEFTLTFHGRPLEPPFKTLTPSPPTTKLERRITVSLQAAS